MAAGDAARRRALAGLEEVPWATLDHAYGSAANVPGVLTELAGAEGDAARQIVEGFGYGSLCHQGSVYSATLAAAPFLVRRLCERGLPPVPLLGALVAEAADAIAHFVEDADWMARPDPQRDDVTWGTGAEPHVRAAIVGLVPAMADALPRVKPVARIAIAVVLAALPEAKAVSVPALTAAASAKGDAYVRLAMTLALRALGEGDAASLAEIVDATRKRERSVGTKYGEQASSELASIVDGLDGADARAMREKLCRLERFAFDYVLAPKGAPPPLALPDDLVAARAALGAREAWGDGDASLVLEDVPADGLVPSYAFALDGGGFLLGLSPRDRYEASNVTPRASAHAVIGADGRVRARRSTGGPQPAFPVAGGREIVHATSAAVLVTDAITGESRLSRPLHVTSPGAPAGYSTPSVPLPLVAAASSADGNRIVLLLSTQSTTSFAAQSLVAIDRARGECFELPSPGVTRGSVVMDESGERFVAGGRWTLSYEGWPPRPVRGFDLLAMGLARAGDGCVFIQSFEEVACVDVRDGRDVARYARKSWPLPGIFVDRGGDGARVLEAFTNLPKKTGERPTFEVRAAGAKKRVLRMNVEVAEDVAVLSSRMSHAAFGYESGRLVVVISRPKSDALVVDLVTGRVKGTLGAAGRSSQQ